MHRIRLDNGLRVIAAPLEHLHTATVSVFVKVGSRFEDPATNGLSHFLEHMLFRGTEEHPSAHEFNLAIEELGGTLSGETHVDYTAYSTSLPPEHVGPALDLFSELLSNPVFRDLEIEKRIVGEEILEGLGEDDSDVDVDNLARDLLFSPHPLGQKITGSIENVEGFDAAALRAHMQRFYGAHNVVLCVAGAIDPQATFDRAERGFGALPPGTAVELTPPILSEPRKRFRYAHDPGSQTDLRLSFPTFGLHDGRHPALQLLLRVLDDGLSSRLHRRICDELGLAYDAFATLESYEDSGVLDLGASVGHAKTPELIDALVQLAMELCEDAVPQRELERARQRYLWDVRSIRDDPEALAEFHGTNALYDLSEDPDSCARRMLDVGAEDVREVARTVFAPGAARLTCVGVLSRSLQQRAQDALERKT